MMPEIRAFEYSLGLITVLVGLGLADLATSLHRLMRVQPIRQWDVRMILAGLYAGLMLVSMWFNVWSIRDRPEVRTYFHYLWMIAEFLLLFLLAAESLPDEPTLEVAEGHYDRVRVRFWTIALFFHLSVFAHWLYFRSRQPVSFFTDLDAADVFFQSAALVVPAALIWRRERRIHIAGLIILIVGIVFAFRSQSMN